MNQKQQTLEQLAESTIRNHLRSNPGLELLPVECAIDKRQVHVAQKADVESFLETISDRFEVSEVDTDVDLHVVEESEALEPEPVILARKRKHHLLYFAGFFKHRPLWTTDSRCAMVFT